MHLMTSQRQFWMVEFIVKGINNKTIDKTIDSKIALFTYYEDVKILHEVILKALNRWAFTNQDVLDYIFENHLEELINTFNDVPSISSPKFLEGLLESLFISCCQKFLILDYHYLNKINVP